MSEYEYTIQCETPLRGRHHKRQVTWNRLLAYVNRRMAKGPQTGRKAFVDPGSLSSSRTGGIVIDRLHQRGQGPWCSGCTHETRGQRSVRSSTQPLLGHHGGQRRCRSEMRSDPPLLTGLSIAFKARTRTSIPQRCCAGYDARHLCRGAGLGRRIFAHYGSATAEIRERDTNARRARDEEMLRWL